MMHLIEILLPLSDNEGKAFPAKKYAKVRNVLMAEFGGMTAFTRAPAEGLWAPGEAEAKRDEIVVFEVMTDKIDKQWWSEYRRRLERQLRQEAVIIRTHKIELL